MKNSPLSSHSGGWRGGHRALLAGLALLVVACGQSGASPEAAGGDERPRGHGDGGHHDDETAEPDGRCDRGFNSAEFNESTTLVNHVPEHHHGEGQVDFSVEEFADAFVDESVSPSRQEVIRHFEDDRLDRKMLLGGVLTPTIEPDPWIPMTDAAACTALADQLRTAQGVADRYPTVADAVADGYIQISPYTPGQGVHYLHLGLIDGTFEADEPAQFMYSGTDPNSPLVGLAYTLSGDEAPEGFAGSNDLWHRHRSVCLGPDGIGIATDVVSEDECSAEGGTYIEDSGHWMVHAWVVPGCESPWGMFSATNPRLPVLDDGVSMSPGCNADRTVADQLDMDEPGAGPAISPQ